MFEARDAEAKTDREWRYIFTVDSPSKHYIPQTIVIALHLF